MKKILAIILASAMALSMAACGAPAASSSAPAESKAPAAESKAPAESAAPADDGKFELALITDIGTIDDKSFNQGAWEGLKKYAEENKVTHKYY
ncbi:MAG: BMP family ABC transporter substrate-binding protein, partial [Hydrogenoanaerobacterium sp.]